VAPPPKTKDSRRQNGVKEDLFGSIPFNPTPTLNIKNEFNDPFEMGEFGASTVTSNPSQQELENAIGLLDKRLLEMKVRHISLEFLNISGYLAWLFDYLICDENFQDGFSRGLCIGTDDFSLESLDPLRN